MNKTIQKKLHVLFTFFVDRGIHSKFETLHETVIIQINERIQFKKIEMNKRNDTKRKKINSPTARFRREEEMSLGINDACAPIHATKNNSHYCRDFVTQMISVLWPESV